MKFTFALPILAAASIATTNHAALAAPLEQPISLLGRPAPAAATADKVVVITKQTPYVNVTSGSTVRFVTGKRSFNWTFDNGIAYIVPFDLQRIAPQGFLDRHLTTYVAADPRYQ